MKDYHEVVEKRYNTESENSIYAPDKPIGKYTRSRIFPCLRNLLKNNVSSKEDYSGKSLLDVGCGNGGMISFFSDTGFEQKNITGIDLSETRIEKAKSLVPHANFLVENGLSFKLDKDFDVITSFDMFSHIITEAEIVKGLKNIREHLADDGVFLWYDIFSKDHFSSPSATESWGYSIEQMQKLGEKSGFVRIDQKTLFKVFFGKYNSVYQVRRFPVWLVKLMEKLLPGTPGNVAMVFRKS